MQKFRNPFAVNEKKEMIFIKTGDIKNKEKYKNCYCPECGEKLIPRMGEKNKWHFSHFSNKQCNGNFETSLHLYAKELIKKNNKILLPSITVGEYLSFNKMDSSFTQDMHKWENENQERVSYNIFIDKNIYSYKWIENEKRIDDFIPDCIVEIGGKKLAVEIYVTHEVDKEKEEKVKKSKIDMIEICLDDIKEEMQEEGFDLNQYILYNATRWWINKTKVESEEKKLYHLIYNTKKYILNEKFTEKDLYEQGIIRERKKEYEEELRILHERQKGEKRKYAIEHKDEYKKTKIKKFLSVIEEYSQKYKDNNVTVYNLPVRGEYVFNCSREIWQKAIYDMFILNREGKNIQLAKIVSWVEKYSGLKYYKEFDYSKDEIWDSKYDAIKNYMIELEKYKIIDPLQYYITKYGENRILNGSINSANLKIRQEYRGDLVCKNCGEIFDNSDTINRFYLTNFELDKECFQRMINNYKIRHFF